jgi:lantibiotic modifying enzyme
VDLSRTPEILFLGFAHGIAGIGYFLLLLQQATGDARWADLARGVAGRLSQHALPDHGGRNWPYFLGCDDGPRLCQWCHGAPGIGLLYTKAYEVLGDPSFLATARAAGDTTYAAGDTRGNPCQCHGLAGNAELLVELYRITGEVRWLERAHEFARMAMAYRTRGPQGDTWQADDAGYDSPDYMCGAAGTGHFFLRLLDPQRVRLPLM